VFSVRDLARQPLGMVNLFCCFLDTALVMAQR
jgi:hypothetical protein